MSVVQERLGELRGAVEQVVLRLRRHDATSKRRLNLVITRVSAATDEARDGRDRAKELERAVEGLTLVAADLEGHGQADDAASLRHTRDALLELAPPVASQLAADDPTLEPFRPCRGVPHLFVIDERIEPTAPAPSGLRRGHAGRGALTAKAARLQALGAAPSGARAVLDTLLAPASPTPRPRTVGLRSRGSETSEEGRAGERAQLERIARDCLEELGMLGHHRRIEPSDRYHAGVAGFEERLLANLDAFMSLGEAGPGSSVALHRPRTLLGWTEDAFVEDVARAFARAFVLGCMTTPAAIAVAVLGLRRSPKGTHAAQADALALVPHPGVDEAMAALSRDGDPAMVRVAAEVLARRGRASVEVLIPLLLHGDDQVRIWASRACLPGGARPELRRPLEDLLEAELEDAPFVAASAALMVVDPEQGRRRLRAWLDDAIADPTSASRPMLTEMALLAGLLGDRRDLPRLAALFAAEPCIAPALGWHGDPSFLPGLLARDDDASQAALARILGDEPSRWAELAEGLDRQARYRHGAVHRLDAILDELAEPDALQADRERLALELRLTHEVTLDPYTWAARQRARLEELRADLG